MNVKDNKKIVKKVQPANTDTCAVETESTHAKVEITTAQVETTPTDTEAICNTTIDTLDVHCKQVDKITLNEDVFFTLPRIDIISQMVRYQLAKRRAGTHSTLNRSEVRGTTKKCKPQKEQGTRHGDKRAPIFRKGGISHGPVPRSHEFKLNKKVKQLALKSSLSLRLMQSKLHIFENFALPDMKTKTMQDMLAKLGSKKVLFVHNDNCPALEKAAGNLYTCRFIKTIGLNTYDIMKYDHIAITRQAVKTLTKRLG